MNPAPAMHVRIVGRLSATASGIGQNILTAFVQLWANRGRSILTTLGIIIAVTAIITVVSFVEGFGRHLTKMLRGYGTQFMVVRPLRQDNDQPTTGPRIRLTLADMQAVRTECDAIRRITPLIFAQTDVSYGKAVAEQVTTRGITEAYQVIRNYYVDAGRFFGPIDVENAANVCVLGRSLLKLLQCDEHIVGQYVQILGRRFLVVGLLEAKGSFLHEDQDQTVMLPYSTMLQMYPAERDRVRFLAEAEGEESLDQAYGQIKRVLRRRHALEPGVADDFEIDRQDQVLREFGHIRMVATAVLAGIVSISLLVGGIGIMNVMFVSVSERTREIGLRKSVGARRRDILLQFLTEAVVLSSAGGVIGVLLGYAIAGVATLHPKMVSVEVPLWSVALAIGFSAGSGVVFGLIPALKAAILHPIDALRHE